MLPSADELERPPVSKKDDGRTVSDPVQIKRVVPADAVRTFERIANSGWGPDGRLTLMSLQQVAQSFGQKWPFRSDSVYEHVERALIRNLGPDALFVRVSETDYLVAQPPCPRRSDRRSPSRSSGRSMPTSWASRRRRASRSWSCARRTSAASRRRRSTRRPSASWPNSPWNA